MTLPTALWMYLDTNLSELTGHCRMWEKGGGYVSCQPVGCFFIPPQVSSQETLAGWANFHCGKLVMGEFNSCIPSHELRGTNTLDHLYATIKHSYHSVRHAPLGHSGDKWRYSDYYIIQIVPMHRQQLKRTKPSRTIVRRWTPEATDMLQDCMECTEWESLERLQGKELI